MSLGIKLVKGMRDLLPDETLAWQFLDEKLKSLLLSYGYQEIRMPILEQSELFKRAIGEVTDIVEKEMYTFIDKGGESLTLRPESTAQCVRAVLENSLIHNKTQRLWYQGPMFRRENPQKGRYRQFTQFGVEAFGLPGPDVDAEQLFMMARLWRQLGLSDKIALQLNSLGTAEERAKYRDALVAYFKTCHDLDSDSQRRLQTNPLRILDSKNPAMKDIIRKAPSLLEYLGTDSLQHFETIQALLTKENIPFEINSRLVRGLDYYTHTVYEWVTTELGAQGTVCAGGRYNDLVTQMGGDFTPCVGFAVGVDRLIMLLTEHHLIPQEAPVDVFLIGEGEKAQMEIICLAEKLREGLPSLRVLTNCGGGSFKSQFKRADKSGALIALIVGDKELEENKVSVKFLRDRSQEQKTITLEEFIQLAPKLLSTNKN